MRLSEPSTTALVTHRLPKAASSNQASGQCYELKSLWVGGRRKFACVTNIQTLPFSSYVPEYPQQRMFHSCPEKKKKKKPKRGKKGTT